MDMHLWIILYKYSRRSMKEFAWNKYIYIYKINPQLLFPKLFFSLVIPWFSLMMQSTNKNSSYQLLVADRFLFPLPYLGPSRSSIFVGNRFNLFFEWKQLRLNWDLVGSSGLRRWISSIYPFPFENSTQ